MGRPPRGAARRVGGGVTAIDGSGVQGSSPTGGGVFIVLEGGDGAGRSTQVRALLLRLEEAGRATLHVGLGRSALARRALAAYRRTPEGGVRTLALLYASDLRDQAEPVRCALAAGFAVVADRWSAAATARCRVRGADPGWLAAILPTEPDPDVTLHLRASPQQRLAREVRKRGVPDFWESGRDLGLHPDPLRSFVRYQSLLDREYAREAVASGARWRDVETAGGVEAVRAAIAATVLDLLPAGTAAVTEHG